jgi:hypothetical protein
MSCPKCPTIHSARVGAKRTPPREAPYERRRTALSAPRWFLRLPLAERRETPAGEQPCQPGEERPVGWLKHRTAYLALGDATSWPSTTRPCHPRVESLRVGQPILRNPADISHVDNHSNESMHSRVSAPTYVKVNRVVDRSTFYSKLLGMATAQRPRGRARTVIAVSSLTDTTSLPLYRIFQYPRSASV